MHSWRPASWITPERLALMAQVGPPDCPTKRFPTNSAIVQCFVNSKAFCEKPGTSRPKGKRNLPSKALDVKGKSRKDRRREHLTFCIDECREGMASRRISLVHGKAEA